MIPLIAITTCNRLDNVTKCIESIKHPVKTLSILVNNSDISYFDAVREIEIPDNIGKVEYSYCPQNMGCASSWNYHMKHYASEPYWVLLSDDVIIGSDELSQIEEKIVDHDGVFADKDCNYIFFALKRTMLQKVGLFDENFHPGCYEDHDYRNRMGMRDDVKTTTFVINSLHNGAPAGSGKGGGGTGHGFNDEQKRQWDVCFRGNQNYYNRKWQSTVDGSWEFDIDERARKELRI